VQINTVLSVLGLAVLIAEGCAIWFLAKWKRAGNKLPVAQLALLITIGVALGCATYFISYYESPTLRIIGAPFPAAAFQLENGRWYDYVGWITAPAMFLNFLVAALVPPAALALRLRLTRAREARQ